MAERVEGGDAGAEKGCRLDVAQRVGNTRECFGRGEKMIGVAPVVRDAAHATFAADDEVAAAAGVADETMATVPPHADAVAFMPAPHTGAERGDDACDLVAGHARELESRIAAGLHEQVAVANAARPNSNQDLTGAGRGNRPRAEDEWPVGGADLCEARHRVCLATVPCSVEGIRDRL